MASSNTSHLLSVEDNPETRLLLTHLLGEDYDITSVPDVDEALDAVDSTAFDLLLLDINLNSAKEGTELLHMIRDREDVEHVPAVALTAYAMPGDREALLDEGFDGYVSKPFTGRELTETIDHVLAARKEPS